MLIVINNRQSIAYVKGKAVEPYDYFCNNCKQLRLACVVVDCCSNCLSPNIVKGKLGTLERSQAYGKGKGQESRAEARDKEA